MGLTDDGIQDAQVVIDFGNGGDGAARVWRGVGLLDGDGRAEALDEIHVWLFQLIQKLPRISAEALDVTTLAFGIEGVKRQGGLARTTDAREHDELVTRDIDVDVLEIVLSRAADSDGVRGHGGKG